VGVLEIALDIVFRLGLPVFPCGGAKKPAVPKEKGGRGFLDASTDEGEVRRLFGLVRAKLVGVPTGPDSGFDVLDVDYRNGGGAWEMENAHRIPRTRIHTTMSGGRHYLFQHIDGVRNSASKKTLALGIDIRGDGGYIIHPTSAGYIVQDYAPIAAWPEWLLNLVMAHLEDQKPVERPSSGTPVQVDQKRYQGFIDKILGNLRLAGDGAKHATLRATARTLGGIQEQAGFSDGQALDWLTDAVPKSAKDWKNVKDTTLYGLKVGRDHPLDLDKDRVQYTNVHSKTNGHAPHSTNGHDKSSFVPTIENPRLPRIRVLNGLRHLASDRALEAMSLAKIEFFQRDRSLVRAALSKAKTSDGSVIEIAGIVPVTTPILGREMGISAEWEKVLKTGEIVRIDPPREVVEQVAAMSGSWPFPPITGVISTPTMRPDGTLLLATGYDQKTGLVMIAPPKMPRIPDLPTRADADAAIGDLQSLIAEFPFSDDASRSVVLSMILTSVLRGALLPAVPMHVATAPQPGTGKSYLADIAAAISTGERCAVIAMSPNPEETEKRLIGAALAGQQIIALDNVSEMLSGDFLNQVTERPLLQLRPLGTSVIIRIANAFTVFANGNNLSAPADLVRRTLVCRLDANLENPEDRTFESDPVKVILLDRGRYVAACLIIARAYLAAGSPNLCRPLPSFEPWSNLVRSPLVWLGMPDPCSSMEMARAEDPIRASRAAVFSAWEKEIALGRPGHTTSELVETAEQYDGISFFCPDFRKACLEVAAERSGTVVSPRRLGKWLSANNNNRIGDLKLTVDRSDMARPRWILTKG
jgi:putative DNA primase/helicase